MNKISKLLVVVAVFLAHNTLIAQSASISELESALGFENSVNDVPEAPIHFLVGLGMIVGSYLGFRKLN